MLLLSLWTHASPNPRTGRLVLTTVFQDSLHAYSKHRQGILFTNRLQS